MGTVIFIIGSGFALLLAFLMIEKRKVKIRDEIIKEFQREAIQQRKQIAVYEQHQELTTEAIEEIEEIEEKHEHIEQVIEEAESDEDVIKIANDIIADFNSK